MRNIIVGTAGHIDHGKTALVGALTGIDTDRLAEEKRRGISIDLGFAHATHGGYRFGFVDVPGHERFVRNMLAGVGGIDLVLLVVAADESIKPQTREHFEICRLLGIRHGLVAITKLDAAGPELAGITRLEVADFVAGSFLEGAPVVAVSANTGEGLNELRAALEQVAARAEARDTSGPFRLPVDRSFSLRGFGTVVTGTLWSGRVKTEDEVEVLPGGRRLRVRSVEVHGGQVAEATAGERTALNLAAVEACDLRRGMVLAPPGLFRATQTTDCRFELLSSAKPLKHRAPVHLHAGTAQVEAEVRLLGREEQMEPGTEGYLRLLIREPLLLLPGDRFILRMFSPVVTIGGGVVLDNCPPEGWKRARVLERLQALRPPALTEFVAESADGARLSDLVARTGLASERILGLARGAGLVVVKDAEPRLATKEALAKAVDRLRQAVSAFHEANPLLPGMPRASAPLAPHMLEAALAAGPEVAAEGELLRLKSHRLALKGEEDEALGRIEKLFEGAGLAVPAVAEVLAKSGVDAARARRLLEILLRQGRLERVSPELIFHATSMAQLRGMLGARKGQRFAVPQFKEWTGISRKYAIPLLEYLDRVRVTRREGDQRVVL